MLYKLVGLGLIGSGIKVFTKGSYDNRGVDDYVRLYLGRKKVQVYGAVYRPQKGLNRKFQRHHLG